MSATIPEIRRARDAAQLRAADILTAARTEGRSLSAVEAAELEGIAQDVENATARIEQLAERQYSLAHAERAAAELPTNRPPQRPTHVLTRSDSLVEHLERSGAPRVDDYDLGRVVRGLVTGDWSGVEQRAMSEGVSANGGITIPSLVSAEIIDRSRNLARVFQAGAQTIAMPNATYRLPRLDTDPAAAWRAELGAVVDVTPSMSGVDLTARSLACLIRVSMELMEDTPDLGAFLTDALASAFAVEIDRTALRGSGTAPEPRGVINTAGISTLSNGANGTSALTLRSDWAVDAVASVRASNFDPSAVLCHPNLLGRWTRNLDTTNQYVQFPAGLPPILHTTQLRTGLTVGTSTDATEVLVGDFTKLAIGVRSQLQVRVLDQRYADTGEVALWAAMRADVAVLRPAAFVLVNGLRIV
jgi:HK97 family phage major capsid protein